MISIAKELDAYDIAQEIRQERQIHKGSFLLLEGERDIKRFSKFVNLEACSIQNCFGRPNLLGAIEILLDEGFPGILGLADADFDRLNSCMRGNEALIYSETHDFDLDIVNSDVLQRYLEEVGHPEKCAAHGGCVGIRALIHEGCKPLSVLRYVSHTQNLKYRLDHVRHRMVCVNGAVDVSQLVDHVSAGHLASQSHKEKIARLVSQHVRLDYAFEQLTNGHDFAALLGLALMEKLGDRKPPQAWSSEVERHLRLAFSAIDFIKMPVFFAIIKWEEDNLPYIVLKSNLKALAPQTIN